MTLKVKDRYFAYAMPCVQRSIEPDFRFHSVMIGRGLGIRRPYCSRLSYHLMHNPVVKCKLATFISESVVFFYM